MADIKQLFANNLSWSENIKDEDPEFFLTSQKHNTHNTSG